MNKEVKIMTTIKEFKSFCRKNNIKCIQDKKNNKLCLTLPPFIYDISKSTYKYNFKYEIEYFMDRFMITVYDTYYDDFNNVKIIYSWDNSQDQILGVLILQKEYVIFTKSEKVKWEIYKQFYFSEFRGENN